MTDQLSKLSLVFTFDKELFISKVYERTLRGSLKRSLRIESEHRNSMKRSQEIDRELKEDSRQLSRVCTVLVLGSADSGKDDIIRQMKIHQVGYSEEEKRMYRPRIYKTLIDSAKTLISAMQ